MNKVKGKEYKYYRATIQKRFIKQFPATIEGEILAAKAYDAEATKEYGQFARLNFPSVENKLR